MKWIREYRMENVALCDELIKGFAQAKEMGLAHPGISGKGLDKAWKDSDDASLNCLPFEIFATTVRAYRDHLKQSIATYLKEFPALLQANAKLGFQEPPQIQHYRPGGGFHGLHFETSGLELCQRVLAVQTYLNDIAEGGGTYFHYQRHTVAPAKGKTVIWPGGFTHTHRGEVAPKEDKYVITAWVSYVGS